MSNTADGVEEIRKAIRLQIKYGADQIKFAATGGVFSEAGSAEGMQYSPKEMRAIVDEAHLWGKRVAAHAHGTQGIKTAVEAGVDSIEHGSLIDEEGIEMMKKRGTYLIPTIFAADAVEIYGKDWNLPESILARGRSINKENVKTTERQSRRVSRLGSDQTPPYFPTE
ncbi:amidohydrolase family protein [bacterium]|nr:amidohydrolase family protein [bacterium]